MTELSPMANTAPAYCLNVVMNSPVVQVCFAARTPPPSERACARVGAEKKADAGAAGGLQWGCRDSAAHQSRALEGAGLVRAGARRRTRELERGVGGASSHVARGVGRGRRGEPRVRPHGELRTRRVSARRVWALRVWARRVWALRWCHWQRV